MNLRALALAVTLPCLAIAADWDKEKVQGSLSAPIAIEIYSSFDCPHCKVLHDTWIPQIMRDLVGTGKACVVSREFPLLGPGHAHAREAANLATAAARIGKYQAVADALYKDQQEWAESGKVWETVAAALSPAEQAKVKALANDPGVLAEVQKDYQQGTAMGIDRTPTLMVIRQKDGRRFPFGTPLSYDLFRDFVAGGAR